jgi:hypothetical protein
MNMAETPIRRAARACRRIASPKRGSAASRKPYSRNGM